MLAIELHVVQEGRQNTGFLLPKDGCKMRLYGLLGGQERICVQSMWQTRGSRGMLPGEILILDLLLYAIWWNLGLFSHKHNLSFMCHYFIDLHIKSNSQHTQGGGKSKPRGPPAPPPRKKPWSTSALYNN